MSCNNQWHVVTIFYLLVNKLMDQSHKKLVHHMVVMQTVFSAPPMKTIWSPLSVGIRSIKIPTQGIAIDSIMYPLKLLSKSKICHYHVYRRYNMTICKQFNEYNMNYNKFSFSIHWLHHNDNASNSLYLYHPPPKVIISSQCMPTFSCRMWNMIICKQFDGVQDSFESILCQNPQTWKLDTRNCC
jgi:hypothetical protein